MKIYQHAFTFPQEFMERIKIEPLKLWNISMDILILLFLILSYHSFLVIYFYKKGVLKLDVKDLLELLEKEEVIEKIKEIVSKDPKKPSKSQKNITPTQARNLRNAN